MRKRYEHRTGSEVEKHSKNQVLAWRIHEKKIMKRGSETVKIKFKPWEFVRKIHKRTKRKGENFKQT